MDALTEALRRKRRSDGIDWDKYGREHDPAGTHLTDPMQRVLTQAFVDTFSDWDRDARMLEAGCGDGFWLETLRNLGFEHIVGIDCSMPLLERAAAKGLDVRRGDLYDLDVIDAFDVVMFCDTLEHLPDPARALQRAHRALRTHATLFLMVPVYESVQCRWRRRWHRLDQMEQAQAEDETHVQAFSSASLMSLLDECYFRVDVATHVGNLVPARERPVRWTRRGRSGKWLFVQATSLFHVGWETTDPPVESNVADANVQAEEPQKAQANEPDAPTVLGSAGLATQAPLESVPDEEPTNGGASETVPEVEAKSDTAAPTMEADVAEVKT
jgi:SAM-dependent methyltransferase